MKGGRGSKELADEKEDAERHEVVIKKVRKKHLQCGGGWKERLNEFCRPDARWPVHVLPAGTWYGTKVAIIDGGKCSFMVIRLIFTVHGIEI